MKLKALAFYLMCGIAMMLICDGAFFAQEAKEDEGPDLHLTRRVNIHGDEFMALAISVDERNLFIGTERGEVLIWNIPERRIVQRFYQGSPVHVIVALADGKHLVAAGGAHTGLLHTCTVRKWNVETGAFEDWQGGGGDSILNLAFDRRDGLVAAADFKGRVTVWEAKTGKAVFTRELEQPPLSLAINDRTIFATTADPKMLVERDDEVPSNNIIALNIAEPKNPAREFVPKKDGRIWNQLCFSPDGRTLAATYYDSAKYGLEVALLDAASGTERTSFQGKQVSWLAPDRLLVFENDQPSRLMSISADGAASVSESLEGGKWHQAGTPSGLEGGVVSGDGRTAWGVFEMGAALAEWNLKTKDATLLTNTSGFPFAMAVLEHKGAEGLLMTGGDDGFVRVWNLSDIALRREFRVTKGVPQSVALLADGRRAVFSSSTKDSPTEIEVCDIYSGSRKILLTIKEPFVRVAAAGNEIIYNSGRTLLLASSTSGEIERKFTLDAKVSSFTVSVNGQWLAASDDKGVLYRFEIANGHSLRTPAGNERGSDGQLAITNNGLDVYSTEFGGAIRRWETRTNTLKELTSVKGIPRTMRLSTDERRLAIGGNHRDVGVYDAQTGDTICYFDVGASDFYVTNVWLRDNRLIYTTDGGVLFDGVLENRQP